MAIEIVRYHPRLKSRVIALQTHLWSADLALNEAYFDWKFERNPYAISPLLYIALDGEQAVGMRGMMAMRWQVGADATPFTIPYPDDLVIAPAYRNAGLIGRLMKHAFADLAAQGFGHVFNLSASPVTFLSSLAMGWRSVGSMAPLTLADPYRARLHRIRRLASALPRVGPVAGKVAVRVTERLGAWRTRLRHPAFAALDVAGRRPEFAPGSGLAIFTSPDARAMADLVTRLGNDGRLRHVRDAQYFTWRFENPTRDYRFIYGGNGSLNGYLVLQAQLPGHPNRARVNIVDWEATSAATLRDLLRVAIDHGRFEELTTWSATLGEGKRTILAEHGFAPAPPTKDSKYRNCLLARPTGDPLPAGNWTLAGRRLDDLSNWDLRLLYSMHG